MLLAIDIGNSNVVVGLYRQQRWQHIWRLPTLLTENPILFYDTQLQNHFLEQNISTHSIHQVVISSVVPDLSEPFIKLLNNLLGVPIIKVGPDLYHQLPISVPRPRQLGTDLYANALALHQLYQKDGIIIDFGTALTFTMVNKEGEILGVNIAPGIKTAIHALFLKTAQLPEVPMEYPSSAVGTNTTHAIQSGILVGYVGLVRHMIQSIRAELGEHYLAIGTGGLVKVLKPLEQDFTEIAPNLTLDGLRLVAELVTDRYF